MRVDDQGAKDARIEHGWGAQSQAKRQYDGPLGRVRHASKAVRFKEKQRGSQANRKGLSRSNQTAGYRMEKSCQFL